MSGGSKGTYKCARCQQPFEAREADRKRGWARFCSKSCKAVVQEVRTSQYRAHLYRQEYGGMNLSVNNRGEIDGHCDAHLFSNEEHDCNKD